MTAKQILIVEDERPIRDMIAFGLRRAGYEVSEAEDCREARAALADARPDLMLVDWMLPDMSGLELTRSLKRAEDPGDSGHHAHRARRGARQGRAASRAAPTTTSPSRSRRASCWRASRPCCAARRRRRRRGDGGRGAEARRLQPPGERRGAESRWGRPSTGCLHFFMTHPERVFSRGQLLDRVWGAISTSKSAPWTCTSAACARRSSLSAGRLGADSARRRLSLLDARRIDDRRGETRSGPWQRCGLVRARAARGHLDSRSVPGAGCCSAASGLWLLCALALYLGWQLAQSVSPGPLAAACARSSIRPTSAASGAISSRQVVRLHRRKQIPQAAPRAAVPRAAPLDRGAARRRHHPQRPERDRLVQPHGRAAARAAPYRSTSACASIT